MKKRLFWCTALLGAAVLSAQALSLVLLSEAAIVQQSDRIVVGTVTTAQAQWLDPDGDGVQSIYTVATFRIDQSIKGTDRPGTLLTLHVFGGTIGNRTMSAPGIPLFKNDERLVLCLYADIATSKFSSIVGAVQGRWTIRTDGNGVDLASRDFSDANFMSVEPNGNLVEAATPKTTEEPLADVVARLQKAVK
jgi:hypothetical protein